MRSQHQSSPGIKVFSLFIFVLAAVPRLNLKIGTLPIYAIDVLVILLLIMLPRGSWSAVSGKPFANLVFAILAFAMLSEIAGIVYGARPDDALYLIVRTCLAFSVFFIARSFVRSPKDIEQILKPAVLGVIVTSMLMITTSLPMTRTYATEIFFSNKYLEPATEVISAEFLEVNDTGVRGHTLIGVSIVGATFINSFWPFAALLSIWPFAIGYWRNFATVACFVAPLAVLMSYSRGPILGSTLILLIILIFGAVRLRNRFVIPIIVTVLVVATVGVGSNLFFFDRLSNRTQAIFEDPLSDERESERILAYVEPFQHVAENPLFIFIGEGNVATRGGFLPEQAGKATHALFAKAYYSYGLIAAVLYMIIIYFAYSTALRQVRARRNSLYPQYSQAMFASFVALLPWAIFGHAIVSSPHGAMLFFLIIGLLTTARVFEGAAQSNKIRKVADADRNNSTI